MSVFVTVGTTEFNSLIEAVCQPNCLRLLSGLGYTNVLLQIGRGSFEPTKCLSPVAVDFYRYKQSLADDIAAADLVISHAGSGTCLEVLGCRKPLIVVVNKTLQDNHQLELAERLAQDQHLSYCEPETLAHTIEHFDASQLRPFSHGQPQVFADWLDRYFAIA